VFEANLDAVAEGLERIQLAASGQVVALADHR
jgi:hypothetical protein